MSPAPYRQGFASVEEHVAHRSDELAAKVAEHSERASAALIDGLAAFETSVAQHGESFTSRVVDQSAKIQATLADQLATFEETVVRASGDAATKVAEHADQVSLALTEGLAALRMDLVVMERLSSLVSRPRASAPPPSSLNGSRHSNKQSQTKATPLRPPCWSARRAPVI